MSDSHRPKQRFAALFHHPLLGYVRAAAVGSMAIFGLHIIAYLIYAEFSPPAVWGDEFTLETALANGWGALGLGATTGALYRRRVQARKRRD